MLICGKMGGNPDCCVEHWMAKHSSLCGAVDRIVPSLCEALDRQKSSLCESSREDLPRRRENVAEHLLVGGGARRSRGAGMMAKYVGRTEKICLINIHYHHWLLSVLGPHSVHLAFVAPLGTTKHACVWTVPDVYRTRGRYLCSVVCCGIQEVVNEYWWPW